MTLSDLPFTDVYLTAGKVAEPFYRSVSGGTIQPFPADLQRDVSTLSAMLENVDEDANEFSYEWNGVRFRVQRLSAVDGRWYVLRRLPNTLPRLSDLGLHPALIDALAGLGREHGLLLFAGRTGEGKTWSASSLFAHWIETLGDVGICIEAPPELPLHGWHGASGYCIQRDVAEADLGDALASCMRSTPRYIMLGEVRTVAAAREVLRAAVNGHVVLTTIHAASIEGALHRLVTLASAGSGASIEEARSILADGLLGVVHQRLLTIGKSTRIEAQSLFAQSMVLSDPVRVLIRDGKIEQLRTVIEAQRARMRT